MDFLPKQILEYCHNMTSNNKLLEELDRETNYKILMPRMLSGKLVGQLLRFISNIKQPKYILEIGTYTGYSAICLADGLKKNGELHTIEINQELETFCKTYFQKAGLEKKIKLHIGNALDIIPNLKYQYDIVFIDADKKNYCQYYNLAMQKLRKGGCIIIDNVLWSGKVIKETDKNDPETSEIKKLNLLIKNDVRVRNTLIPIRDGLMICELL